MMKDVEERRRGGIAARQPLEDLFAERRRQRTVDAARAKERDRHLGRRAFALLELLNFAWREAQIERGVKAYGIVDRRRIVARRAVRARAQFQQADRLEKIELVRLAEQPVVETAIATPSECRHLIAPVQGSRDYKSGTFSGVLRCPRSYATHAAALEAL